MLKIMILEDKRAESDRLAGFLNRFGTERTDFVYSLEIYERGIHFLDAYRGDADLIFLDIRLPDMLGMEVAQHIRRIDQNVMIIFVTNLTQYAIDGYSVEAFDYILKPIHYASFSAKLERALRMLSYREPEMILELRTKDSTHKISAASVIYIESAAHDLLFHTGSEVIKQWGTLSQYERMLQSFHFARPSASYLVNLKFVRSVKKDEVLVIKESIPLSRSKRKDFLAALAQYKGGSI